MIRGRAASVSPRSPPPSCRRTIAPGERLARASLTIVPVPGAFELPLAAMALAKTRRFSCIVALGCVIRGETPHFDFVAGEAASGLQLAAIETGVPVSFGLLTLETESQAESRIGKGAEAARAALEMADLFTQVRTRADTVAGGRDAPDEIGRRRRLPAEHEERGGHVILRQHIEHPRGEDGVRAIVERKSHNLVRRSHLAPRQIANATHRHESTRGPLTALHDRAGHRERRRSRMLRERMGVLRGACRRPGEGWSRGLRVPVARLAAGHQR